MTDFAALLQPDKGQSARTIRLVDPAGFGAWLEAQPPQHRAAVEAQRMTGMGYARAILPGETAEDWSVATVVADVDALSPWCLAKLAETLPGGVYRIEAREPGAAALGWLLAQHSFDRYKQAAEPTGPRILLTSAPARIDETLRLARAVALARDLVDTPAADMGPAALEAEAQRLAAANAATLTVTRGDDLAVGYPMIHAVGRAAAAQHAPRLIELEWGDPAHPRLAVIGKGVCFDSGGLDIKPASGMKLMKKDMGGAAHALALAGLIMENRLPVRLHLLVPAVENAISADAFRPGDVLRARNGLTVEITNTDAEGRLVLGDVLVKAGEGAPVLMIDFATLTGAARTALGPELVAMFANDDALAGALVEAGKREADPMWRLPLWPGYRDMLKSDIADMQNSPDGPMAGAVVAALFLERFVPAATPWAHFDTFAWMPSAKPGRPKGGAALGLRAAWSMLLERFAPR